MTTPKPKFFVHAKELKTAKQRIAVYQKLCIKACEALQMDPSIDQGMLMLALSAHFEMSLTEYHQIRAYQLQYAIDHIVSI